MKTSSWSGCFIVFEGTDGTGKSTQLMLLAEKLISLGYETLTTMEPSNGEYGRRIRQSFYKREELSAQEELELFLSDRKDHLKREVLPALQNGKIVLCDRYFLSTVAYQGPASKYSQEQLLQMNSFAPPPDIAFILHAPVEICLKRITANRGEIPNDFEKKENLIRVASIFSTLDFPWIYRVDASESQNEVAQKIYNATRTVLPEMVKS